MKKTANTNVEKTFTLEQATEEIKQKEEAKNLDRQKRLQEFVRLFQEAEAKTDCTFQIDFNSTLNDLKIMPISKT